MKRSALLAVALISILLETGCGKSAPSSPPPGYKDPVDMVNMPAMPKDPAPVTSDDTSGGPKKP